MQSTIPARSQRFVTRSLTQPLGLALTATLSTTLAFGISSAQAAPIFSQTPTVFSWSTADRDTGPNGGRSADEFQLASDATIDSVTWRGLFTSANTPIFPLDFDLTFYDDNGGVPGTVLSNTSVSVTGVDTGIDLTSGIAFDVYEFTAATIPTALTANTTYWFSPLADTTNDGDDDFWWANSMSQGADYAFKSDLSGPWAQSFFTEFYFELDDAGATNPVPEPTSLALLGLGLGALGLRARRRRSHR